MHARAALVCAAVLLLAWQAGAAGRPLLGPRGSFDSSLCRDLAPELWSGAISVKIADGMGPALDGLRIVDGNGMVIVGVLPCDVGRAVQGFGMDPDWLAAVEAAGERRCACDLASLADWFTIEIGGGCDDLAGILAELGANPFVETACPVVDASRIPPPDDIPPATPSYLAGQGYLEAAPGGIDALFAWTIEGGMGGGTTVVDLEAGWDYRHEDLETCLYGEIPGVGYWDRTDLEYVHHGTAVLGVMVAGDNGYGVTGIVPEAGCRFAPDYTEEYGVDMPRAMVMAMAALPPSGTVLLLEAQTAGPNYDWTGTSQDGLVPEEWEPPVFDAIRLAVANGYIVVEAAGNGREDLDDERYYAGLFDREVRDSGAIIVGAGQPPSSPAPRAAESFSNYGSRIDLQGWGSAVVTTGYGDLFDGGGDIHQVYTSWFAGTSSASPIVAGAAASLAGMHRAHTGEDIDPLEVRDFLVSTGTPQLEDGRHIGPLPNLRAATGKVIASCGDSILHEDEVCDDGNTTPGDGCSADCRSDETCGNAVTDGAVGEACDDGNTTPGDGCSADCRSDETCGNGVTDGVVGEACDDGNTIPGDGCSADCGSDETCGNAILDTAALEECDDGNVLNGDGCSRLCTVEHEDKGCGCSMPGGHAGAGWLPVLAAALLLAGALRAKRGE